MTITEKSEPDFSSTVKLVALRAPQVSDNGEYVRLKIQLHDVLQGGFVTCFTKGDNGVELRARAIITPTSSDAFEIVFAHADFEAARGFLKEQWDLDEGFDDLGLGGNDGSSDGDNTDSE